MNTTSSECDLFLGIQRRQRRYDEIRKRLTHLERETKLVLMSTRSQRVLGPRKTDLPSEEDTEIFIVNLSPYALEDDIYYFLQQAGNIVQIRLMLTASGIYNRGYCFVKFSKAIEAAKAVTFLHNKFMLNFPRNFVTIIRSSNNRRLYVSGIPTSKTKMEIMNELLMVGFQWLQNVIIYTSNIYGQENRGYAFLEFPSHHEAAAMRSKFCEVTLFGQKVFLAWSRPEIDLKPDILKNVTILYLRPVPIDMAQKTLHYILRTALHDDILIHRLYKKPTCNYAFVHFETHVQAERAYYCLKNMPPLYFSETVEVKWAMPPDLAREHKQSSKARSYYNYCMHERPLMHMREGMPLKWSEFIQNQIDITEEDPESMYNRNNACESYHTTDAKCSTGESYPETAMSGLQQLETSHFNGNNFTPIDYADYDNEAWDIIKSNLYLHSSSP